MIGYIVGAGELNTESPTERTHSALINISDSRRFRPSCHFVFGGRHVAWRLLSANRNVHAQSKKIKLEKDSLL